MREKLEPEQHGEIPAALTKQLKEEVADMDRREFQQLYNEQKREENKKALYRLLKEMHKDNGSDGAFLQICQFILTTPISEFDRNTLLGLRTSVNRALERMEEDREE